MYEFLVDTGSEVREALSLILSDFASIFCVCFPIGFFGYTLFLVFKRLFLKIFRKESEGDCVDSQNAS